MKISLAAPVYNDSSLIQEFIRQSADALKSLSDDIEIVLVNDCSPDDSLAKIKEVLPRYPFIKVINLTKNSGQHIATSIGLRHTTGDFVFMMDSDLQVSPKYMTDFFVFLREHPSLDIVSANRLIRSQGPLRKMGSYLISKLLQRVGGAKLNDIGSTFKLFTRKALDKILDNDILSQNIPILMMNLNFQIAEIPIEYKNHQGRESNYNYRELVFAIVLAFLNFSTAGSILILLLMLGVFLTIVGTSSVTALIVLGMINQAPLPTNLLMFFLILAIIGIQFLLLSMIVFKLERVNKNLDFRRAINQRIDYEN